VIIGPNLKARIDAVDDSGRDEYREHYIPMRELMRIFDDQLLISYDQLVDMREHMLQDPMAAENN
jgi:hypothetical protein